MKQNADSFGVTLRLDLSGKLFLYHRQHTSDSRNYVNSNMAVSNGDHKGELELDEDPAMPISLFRSECNYTSVTI